MLRNATNRLLKGAIALLDRAAAVRRRGPSARARHLVTGERGETAAFFYLREMGYVVVARRWRSSRRKGDIDLIAWEGDTLCIVEVKTRTSREIAAAETAVDEEKQRTLRSMARHYIRHLRPPPELRFDVLSVYFETNTKPQFELIRNAFHWA